MMSYISAHVCFSDATNGLDFTFLSPREASDVRMRGISPFKIQVRNVEYKLERHVVLDFWPYIWASLSLNKPLF